jgi:hypothetical protein
LEDELALEGEGFERGTLNSETKPNRNEAWLNWLTFSPDRLLDQWLRQACAFAGWSSSPWFVASELLLATTFSRYLFQAQEPATAVFLLSNCGGKMRSRVQDDFPRSDPPRAAACMDFNYLRNRNAATKLNSTTVPNCTKADLRSLFLEEPAAEYAIPTVVTHCFNEPYRLAHWCPEGDLNPHTHRRATDFKSAASADFAIRAWLVL